MQSDIYLTLSLCKEIGGNDMKKFKKIMAIGCTLAVAFSSVCATIANANGVALSSETELLGSGIPSTNDAIYLPNETGSFTYDLNNNSVQYSDFVIVPTVSNMGIKCKYSATDKSHSLTIDLYNRSNSSTPVATKRVTASVGVQKEFQFDFMNLKVNQGYYLKLTSSNGGKGSVTVY